MAMRRNVMAMLLCAVFVAVFAAPLVQSGDGEVHLVLKDENGPPSTCAETWDFTLASDGTWQGAVVNYGMRWVILDVVDTDTGALLMDREMFRFAEYGDSFLTPVVDITASHKISVTATPNGPLGTSLTVEDVITVEVPENDPPEAAFTYSVDGVTVSVDASNSDDSDGSIVSYVWNWGDGTITEGLTSTHTYAVPESEALASAPVVEDDIPDPPFMVVGYTFAADGATKLPYCDVTITNVNTGAFVAVSSGSASFYSYDISGIGYTVGDTIHVEAVNGDLFGENEGVIVGGSYMSLNIVLVYEEPPPVPFQVTITLTVTDDDGAIDTVSKTIWVNNL